MNVCYIFCSKLILSVVQLTQIELVTEEDKAYGIDYWAKLLLYVANADEIVRQQCRARADAEIREMRLEYAISKLENENTELKDENTDLKDEIERLRAKIAELMK